MSNTLSKIEYRIKPVTRHIVTRYHEQIDEHGEPCGAGSEQRGEFDNPDTAYQVAYAMAKLEHEQQGWPMGDERIQYPLSPGQTQRESNFRTRLMQELSDLQVRSDKLLDFLGTEAYAQLADIEMEDLRLQHDAMRSYLNVLTRRVSRLCNNG